MVRGHFADHTLSIRDHGCNYCGSNPILPGNDVSTGEVTVNYVRKIPFDLRFNTLICSVRSPPNSIPDLVNAAPIIHNLHARETTATLSTVATLLAAKAQHP